MTELPIGWADIKLADAVTLKTGPFGSALHKSDYVTNGVPLINPMHIVNGKIRPTADVAVTPATVKRLSDYCLREGDLIMERRGEMGRSAVVRATESGWLCGTGSLIVRPDACLIDAKFLHYYLSSAASVRYLLEASVGSTMANLNQRHLLSMRVYLPPRAEQVRIVEKIEELLSDLDAGVAELRAAQKKLDLYRQSLLKSAVEGELTAKWREQRRAERAQQGEPLETGEQLLARILTERRARWEQEQVAAFKDKHRNPPGRWREKYQEPRPLSNCDFSTLPEGWTWATLNQLVARSSYGTSVKCSYNGSETPVLRIPNIVAGEVNLQNLKFSNQALDLDDGEYLHRGDLLIVRTNGSTNLVGRVAQVHKSLE